MANSAALKNIDKAQTRWNDDAQLHQKSRRWLVRIAIAFGPVAVVLLATQSLIFPDQYILGIILIGSELIALAAALIFGFLSVGKETHAHWVDARLRAELFRRERFLFCARLGPYLNMVDQEAELQSTQRLVALNDRLRDPAEFLPLADSFGKWRHAFEDAHAGGKNRMLQDLSKVAEEYLKDRLAEQRIFSRRELWKTNLARADMKTRQSSP